MVRLQASIGQFVAMDEHAGPNEARRFVIEDAVYVEQFHRVLTTTLEVQVSLLVAGREASR
jgi:hypothetical protein